MQLVTIAHREYSLRIGVKDGWNSIKLEKLPLALILSPCSLTEVIITTMELTNPAVLRLPLSVTATQD